MSDNFQIITVAERRDIFDLANEIVLEVWPEFMLHDPICDKLWWRLAKDFPGLQFGLWDQDSESLAAFANSLALHWDRPLEELPAGGIDWVLPKSFEDVDNGRTPNLQCALQIVIPKARQGQGLSSLMVRHMMELGRQHNLDALVAPVRPNLKHRYPLIPCEEYITWQADDGLPFDPWLRVHARLGGQIIGVCEESMDIRGSVADWEKWTGMKIPAGGDHIIPGGLVPVTFDKKKDNGVYIEPNVWTVHRFR